MTIAEGNVGVAFGLTFASGAATILGASVVFFPKLVKLASRRVLAGSLGFSAGVMIYISFVDIFQKSVNAFALEGMEGSKAYGFATLCLFIGVFVMKIVEIIVHRLSGDHHPNRRDIGEDIQITWNENEGQCEMREAEEQEFIVPHCVGCSADPVGDLKKWQLNADAEIYAMYHESTRTASTVTNGSMVINDKENVVVDVLPTVEENNDTAQGSECMASDNFSSLPHGLPQSITASGKVAASDIGDEEENKIIRATDEMVFRAPTNSQLSPTEEKKKLVRMGLSTSAAITVHNFPEGLATFVAALTDPSSGVLLAIAIGAHNIPEGFCVSLPIYYATGSRWKGFLWGFVSGMAEPVAAIMGYIVLANAISDLIYAVMFGLVSGMMIMISTKELLPTAHRYDPEDAVVTTCTITGMAVMALSLVIFKTV